MESVESKIPALAERLPAFRVVNQELDFTFEVWPSAPMSDESFQGIYHTFLARQDTLRKRESLAGCIIKHMINYGPPGRTQP